MIRIPEDLATDLKKSLGISAGRVKARLTQQGSYQLTKLGVEIVYNSHNESHCTWWYIDNRK